MSDYKRKFKMMDNSKSIKIGIGSTCSKPGDLESNLNQIEIFAKQGKAHNIDILLTPEMSATGYGGYQEVLSLAEEAGKGEIYSNVKKIAQDNKMVICVGFVEKEEAKRFISHYVVYPDGSFFVQRKHRVTKTEAPLNSCVDLIYTKDDEIGHPKKEDVKFQYFFVKNTKCAIAICADYGIKNLNEILYNEGVELLLVPTGAGGERKDRVITDDLVTQEGRDKYLRVLQGVFFPGTSIIDCIKYRRAMAAVNMCGYDGKNNYHVGHGMIINSMGEVPGFFHGIPNLDRQRPMFTNAEVEI